MVNNISKQERIERINKIEAEFLLGLAQIGINNISSTFDLLELKRLNSEQISYILSWLPRMNNEFGSREMLVRGLAIADAPFDGSLLKKEFDKKENSFNLKWAIGNTIASTYVNHVKEWILEKFDNRTYAKENEMLVYALIRYFPYEIAIKYLRDIFLLYPLQAAGAIAKIGTKEDLNFLQAEIEKCPNFQKVEIKKSMKKLEHRLIKK